MFTGLLLVSWGASERWRVFWYSHPWMAGMRPGGLDMTRDPVTMYRMPNGWYFTRGVDGVERVVWPKCEVEPNRVFVQIPFWILAVIAGSASFAAWRFEAAAQRRARAGACVRCGYSLAGLPVGAVCPECSAKTPAV